MAEIDCSVAQTLSVIGEWWTLMILRNAFHGMRTFDAFREYLGISTSVLSDRLKTLTDAGIFRKVQSPTDGRSFEYRLTAKGMDLYPILVGMVQWGEKHMPSEAGPRVVLVEKATGEPVAGAFVLSGDGRPVHAWEVEPMAGPGTDETMRVLISES